MGNEKTVVRLEVRKESTYFLTVQLDESLEESYEDETFLEVFDDNNLDQENFYDYVIKNEEGGDEEYELEWSLCSGQFGKPFDPPRHRIGLDDSGHHVLSEIVD